MEVEEPAVKYENLPKLSFVEFIDWEREQKAKHEYYYGEIITMAGASFRHNQIVSNTLRQLFSALHDSPCNVYTSDLRVEIKAKESFVYPDITLLCEPPEFSDDQQDILINPSVIIEVLFPSTEKYDTSKKMLLYMQVPSLQQYIMIDSAERSIRKLSKTISGTFQFEVINNDYLVIEPAKVELTIGEIYKDLIF